MRLARWELFTLAALVAVTAALAQTDPCRGHVEEYGHSGLGWSSVTGAEWYEVERRDATTWTVVGDTRSCNRTAYDDMQGTVYPARVCTSWDVLLAPTVPAVGVTYEYRVRSCRAMDGCGVPSAVLRCGPHVDPTWCGVGPC